MIKWMQKGMLRFKNKDGFVVWGGGNYGWICYKHAEFVETAHHSKPYFNWLSPL